ncbi:hypothetical protein [Burkholderia pyrrocinia]|nr:hypothetical protein [Burkholderia pyrrocinia]QVN21303.1 hypothetical protein JYG32_32815 [Burkholderia pyrrocinia]
MKARLTMTMVALMVSVFGVGAAQAATFHNKHHRHHFHHHANNIKGN